MKEVLQIILPRFGLTEPWAILGALRRLEMATTLTALQFLKSILFLTCPEDRINITLIDRLKIINLLPDYIIQEVLYCEKK